MALDFPSSPATGQAFGGFVWDGATWERAPAGAAQTALPKNYIVNPSMQWSQQNGNTAAQPTAYYTADQWYTSGPAGTSAQRVQVTTPSGAVDRVRITVTTGGGAADVYFQQKIEGQRIADLRWGSPIGMQAVLRFGAKIPAGNYSVGIYNAGFTRVYMATWNVSVGNTDTIFTIVIPPCTDGTWAADNTTGMIIYFWAGATSSPSTATPNVWLTSQAYGITGQTQLATTTSNVFELFDVGLYADPYKTGVAPPYVVPEPFNELRKCQRYWVKMSGSRGGVSAATTAARNHAPFPVPMRAIPTYAIVGAPKVFDGTATPTITAVAGVSNTYALEVNYTAAAGGMTVGRANSQYMISTEADYIACSARM